MPPSIHKQPQRRSGSWTLGHFFGIETNVHWSFLLILAWAAFAAWRVEPSALAMGAGVVFTILMFSFVLLHELGHALMARRFGIQTRAITLLPIGGVAELERMPEKPREEFLVAIAGPAVNVVLALGFGALGWVLGALGLSGGVLGFLLGALTYANVALAVFNLLPAFPMDGGRVFRALLSASKGRVRATEVAATVGKVFAVGFGIYGLLYSPMMILLAAFVWFAGQRELDFVRRQDEVRRHVHDAVPVGGVPQRHGRLLLSPVDAARIEALLAAGHRVRVTLDDGTVLTF